MSAQIVRRHFNVTEYYRMMEAGILSESDHVELIDGEVIEVSPIGSRHAACVDRLNRLFNKFEDVIVRVQSPNRLDDFSEPSAVSRARPVAECRLVSECFANHVAEQAQTFLHPGLRPGARLGLPVRARHVLEQVGLIRFGVAPARLLVAVYDVEQRTAAT